ncbi:MAG TPA: hypothetical protein VFO89_10195 [Thermoanaerobaculia bacterium]|nr:hypothetical protein [Thermoanaerobaculia bacterium]
MRTTTAVRNAALAVSFVAVLATTAPASAREAREGQTLRGGDSPVVRVVKRVVKKVFGVTILETPTLPLPRT